MGSRSPQRAARTPPAPGSSPPPPGVAIGIPHPGSPGWPRLQSQVKRGRDDSPRASYASPRVTFENNPNDHRGRIRALPVYSTDACQRPRRMLRIPTNGSAVFARPTASRTLFFSSFIGQAAVFKQKAGTYKCPPNGHNLGGHPDPSRKLHWTRCHFPAYIGTNHSGLRPAAGAT